MGIFSTTLSNMQNMKKAKKIRNLPEEDILSLDDGVFLVYNQTGGYNCYRLYDSAIMNADESTWHYGANTTDIKKDGSLKMKNYRHTEFNK